MRLKTGKLILIVLAAVLMVGGVAVANHMQMLHASGAPNQHGLTAAQPRQQEEASVSDLSAQVNYSPNGRADPDAPSPFSLIPTEKSPIAPDFALTTLDGKTVKLSDAVKKGPVLLDFWAIWCGPCRLEMPELGAVYDKYKARGFQVYGINSDASVGQMQHFFRTGSPGYPMLSDSGGVVATSYGIGGIPALFIVDRNQRVRAASVGFDPSTQTDLPQSLDQLLAESPQKTI